MFPDVDDFDSFGGPIRNYRSVTDPTTDEDAKFRNRYVATVAMMTQIAPRALASFVVTATGPADPVDFVHAAGWGKTPDLRPAYAPAGLGMVDITWPLRVPTPLTKAPADQGGGATVALNLRRAIAFGDFPDGVVPGFVWARVIAPNKVRVFSSRGDGAMLADMLGATITTLVW